MDVDGCRWWWLWYVVVAVVEEEERIEVSFVCSSLLATRIVTLWLFIIVYCVLAIFLLFSAG